MNGRFAAVGAEQRKTKAALHSRWRGKGLFLKTTGLPSKIERMHSGIGELVFDVIQDQDGGFVAECLSESIATEADTWQELRANVKEAVSAFFFDGSTPERIRLHLVRDEVFTLS
jgi:hypothetical protein